MSHYSSDEDEQLARDMQLALELQDKEERKARKQARKSKNNDHNPGGFVNGNITKDYMLFVSAELDGRLAEILVDSGAGYSAMTIAIMIELGLEKKLSTDIKGTAGGVGSANIIGVCEGVILTVGHVEFPLFFLVLDSPNRQLILGLDTMRKYKCLIDLDSNELVFGGKDGVSVPFMDQECAADAVERMTTEVHYEEGKSSSKKRGGGLGSIFGRKK